jgi:hypothetical protein
MESPEPLAIKPIPLRGRRDGWSAERQRAFISFLSQGFRPARAVRLTGKRGAAAESFSPRDAELLSASARAAGSAASPHSAAMGAVRCGLRRRRRRGIGPLRSIQAA